jgi:hypothetical protein
MRARGNEQVVELIGFWGTRMGGAGRQKGNKYASRGATSQGGSRFWGETETWRREKMGGGCTRERRMGE